MVFHQTSPFLSSHALGRFAEVLRAPAALKELAFSRLFRALAFMWQEPFVPTLSFLPPLCDIQKADTSTGLRVKHKVSLKAALKLSCDGLAVNSLCNYLLLRYFSVKK